MTHIKTWQERAGTFKETYLGAAALAHADTHLHVQAELNELRSALAQQGEPVCAGCGIPAGDVHMSTCKSGKWPSRVSNGDTAAPAAQAQPVAQPLTNSCHTCDHYQQGKRPGVSIHDDTCYGCSEYYANKWEAKSD